ncbi:hypothetical protein LOTGIDRAFT_235673 [Lottia gigantea]|uniref:EGF-like domain-containing protein n=1 Tax=Lottia gigantea TaxID=225164 RepID=V3ZTL8_LOTGI|nr:hypothetical protein LOTGIDRAFT_235673 [Lottia gigantea]ESO85870.1 hypothetical protein LOTGIDRAFT_235673 [Lottia gigantea]
MLFLAILIIIGMVLAIGSANSQELQKVLHTSCDELNCENDNPCQSVTNDGPTQATCFCQGPWTGSRCELAIIFITKSVTDDSVELEVKGRNSKNISKILQYHQKYTIRYWSNSTEHACMLVQDVASPTHVIDGLSQSVQYTFCAETGIVDFCEVRSFGSGLPSNCVSVLTLNAYDQSESSEFFNVGVSLIVVFSVLIFITIVVIVLVKKYQPLTFNVLLRLCFCCSIQSQHEFSSHNDQSSVFTSTDTPIYKRSKRKGLSSSKSKTKSRLAKRAKDYGAEGGNQTLTTLIEDTEDPVVIETSLVEVEPLAQQHIV